MVPRGGGETKLMLAKADLHSPPTHPGAVKLPGRVLCVPRVVHQDESKACADVLIREPYCSPTWRSLGNPDIPDPSKLVEGLLQLPPGGILTQVSNVHLIVSLFSTPARGEQWFIGVLRKVLFHHFQPIIAKAYLAFEGPVAMPVRVHP